MANRILIFGASGFIGKILYKELLPYFDVYGTFRTSTPELNENKVMFHFDIEADDINLLLQKIQPNFIISSLRGNFKSQFKAHQDIINFTLSALDCKLLYLSSVNVFDAKSKLPCYEKDGLLAESDYGKCKVSLEKLIINLPKNKFAILRLPLVLGVNSPRIIQLKEASKYNAEFEVYPNLIISATTANKIAQQVHYIINKDLNGIFHLSSNDMIYHHELFEEISSKLELKNVIFKNIYSSNEDRYLAILPKYNKLPKNYQITISEIIEDCVLKEEIGTLK